MQQQRPKSKGTDNGEWKLCVFFENHQSRNGRAYYFWSNRAQDKRGTGMNRLKRLVTHKWNGKVAWAGLYHSGQLLHVFKRDTNEWEAKPGS